MRNMKETLFSKKGMKLVNTLFILSLFFYKSGLIFIAYLAWIVYLLFCTKQTKSKGIRVIYCIFIGIAIIMICINLYFLLFN